MKPVYSTLEQITNISNYTDSNYVCKKAKIKSYDEDRISLEEDFDSDISKKDGILLSPDAFDQLTQKFKIRKIVKSILSRFEDEDKSKKKYTKFRGKNRIISDIIEMGLRQYPKSLKLVVDKRKNLKNQPNEVIGNRKEPVVMAVVGNRYSYLSNKFVLENAVERYGENIDTRFSFVNDRNLSVFFIGNDSRTSKLGEQITQSLTLNNSETGFGSVSLQSSYTFFRCTNGLIIDNVNNKLTKYHTSKLLRDLYLQNLESFSLNWDILENVDDWSKQPPLITRDINTKEGEQKFFNILNNYGIKNEEDKIGILKVFKTEQESNIPNSYWIGNAVNYYASNVLENVENSRNMLISAYNIMKIQ